MVSLVWSANPLLSGPQVRQILEDTAMDLGDAGRDNTFGNGLVDAGLAVRRASALATDYNLAMLPLYTSANPGGPPSTYIVSHSASLATAVTMKTAPVTAMPAKTITHATSAAVGSSVVPAPPSVVDSVFADHRFLTDQLSAPATTHSNTQHAHDPHTAHANVFAGLARTNSPGTTAGDHDGGLFHLDLRLGTHHG